MGKRIACEHCRSTDVELNDEYYALVQQMTDDGVPMGEKRLFLVFECRSCGKTFYTEDIEGIAN
jgi:DNA-directed RNA polymerase subunit RPC12/RpoP